VRRLRSDLELLGTTLKIADFPLSRRPCRESRIFRCRRFKRLSIGPVLYITPSKNIKKFSQSDHGNILFEVVEVPSHQRNWELRAPRQPRITRIVRNGRVFCSPNSLQLPRVA
jgi:hypothetical protein